MAKACKRVRVKIGRRTFMARKGSSCGPRRKHKLPAALRVWARAAKACRGQGKIGSGKRTSCLRRHANAK